MYQNFRKHLQQELEGIRNAGLYKTERIITSPQNAKIKEPETLCELLSDEDMEKIFQFKEEKQNETV